jgi:polysaccharide biosynthesis PFTS motif protein
LENGYELIPTAKKKLKLNGIVIDQTKGEVCICLRFRVRSLLVFCGIWFGLLKGILLGYFRRPIGELGRAAIVYGMPVSEDTVQGNDKDFVHFCRNGLIDPLANPRLLIIQGPQNKISLSDPSIIYAVEPIRALIQCCKFSFSERGKLLFSHIFLLFNFIFLSLISPLMVLLNRDLAFLSCIRFLDRHNLIESVVITDSNFSLQPLWMREPANRNFRVHSVHYSQNSKPHVYAHDNVAACLPEHKHVRVDEHWVWTHGYKSHLQELGHEGSIHVVGPILFYLPPFPGPLPPQSNEIVIAVFDVTPVHYTKARDLGIINNYYSTDHVIQFIDEIVEVCRHVESVCKGSVRVCLKHKRQFVEGVHDRRYKDHIESLVSQEQIDIIDHSTNLYSLLSTSDLSISIPYTSVAYVANELELDSIYFDPTQELLPSHEPTPYIHFASGAGELIDTVRRIVKKSPKNVVT